LEVEAMKRLVTRSAATVAVAGFMLVAADSAIANTVTVGSDLSAPRSDANTCTTLCTAVQQAGGTSPHPLTSPVDGTVTEWAIRSTDNVTYAFRILRPGGTNRYTGAGTALGVDPGGSNTPVLRFPVSLPIKAGDAIGIGPASGDIDVGVPQINTPAVTSNVWATNSTGQPVDGASATFTPQSGHELLLQATVRYCLVPNVHKLKKAAAKQALAAADCGVKVKKKDTHKKKFRGKVLKQKKAAGTALPPGTVVPIVIGQK
jgi:PASTA domain-containing protein